MNDVKKQALKLLHLEDIPEDAELVVRELKKSGLDFRIHLVNNKKDFITALKDNRPDIILSDHSLPSFDSHEALSIVKSMDKPIPFILVTATVSQEYAVEILKSGASDYILKGRLQRLPTAILAVLDKYNAEAEKAASQEALLASERKYKLLFDDTPLPMWMVSKSTMAITGVNKAAVIHYGYSREEFLQLNARDLYPAEDKAKLENYLHQSYPDITKVGLWRHVKKDGSVITVEAVVHDVLSDGNLVRLVSCNDMTDRLRAEADLARQLMLQQKLMTETSVQVQERERKNIGEELHDNINQLLATANLYLDIARENYDPAHLLSSKSNILLAIEEIRKLSHSLVAPSLGNITLVQAINDLIYEIRLASRLELHLKADHYEEASITREMKLMLYRIVQEQVNNIIKHSGADTATIVLYTGDDHTLLSVTDNGDGFDDTQHHEGIGLRNIRNRADVFDGEVKIISQPGKGCRLEVKIPVQAL